MSFFATLRRKFGFHPRAWLHSFFTYPRFLGRIKPELLVGREEEILARLQALNSRWEPARLEVPVGKRLLVIAPHPDDESIGAGGLLLAHKNWSEIHLVTLFSGEGGGRLPEGPWTDSSEYRLRLVAARKRELAEVSAQLGVKSVTSLDLIDGGPLPMAEDANRLARIVDKIKPDVILLPWFLDNQRDHKVANVLFASACADISAMVLAFEIWTLCQPNAFFDTTDWMDRKSALVDRYRTQTQDIDYAAYARGLGAARGFLQGIRRPHGTAEAFFALPARSYCDLVRSLYGTVDELTAPGRALR